MKRKKTTILTRNLDNLAIEVTRRCNLKCRHCLRGDAQNLDIDVEQFKQDYEKIIDGFEIEKNKSIFTLGFSGGEPLLNIKAIYDIFNFLKFEKNIDIQNFFIATNGTKFSIESLKLFQYLYENCSDNDISQVKISNSQYHIEERKNLKITPKNFSELILDYESLIKDFPKLEDYYDNVNDEYDYYSYDLKIAREINLDILNKINIDTDELKYINLINRGRAKNNNIGDREPSYRNYLDKYETENENGDLMEEQNSMEMIYYSANGKIIYGYCDLSFEEIDKNKKKKPKI